MSISSTSLCYRQTISRQKSENFWGYETPKNEIEFLIQGVRADQLKYAQIPIYSIIKQGKLHTGSHPFTDRRNGRSRTHNPSSGQRRLPDISITMAISWNLSNTGTSFFFAKRAHIPGRKNFRTFLKTKKAFFFFYIKQ